RIDQDDIAKPRAGELVAAGGSSAGRVAGEHILAGGGVEQRRLAAGDGTEGDDFELLLAGFSFQLADLGGDLGAIFGGYARTLSELLSGREIIRDALGLLGLAHLRDRP